MFDVVCVVFFCFKQKTAYEMRISDWSADVCSSDLDVVAMTESEATFALPAPLDPNGQPVAGDPASALLRAAPVSNAERWVTEADEQIRRGRLGTPAGDNARDSLLAAQRSDASYLGLPAAVDRFVDASADAAVPGIRDKNDRDRKSTRLNSSH